MPSRLSALWRVPTAPFRWVASGIRNTSRFLTDEPEETPLGDVIANAATNVNDVFVHLDILRRHLLRATVVLAICTAIAAAFASRLMAILAQPVGGLDKLQAIDVTEQVGTFMRVSLLTGFAIALPYIAFELWLFIAPGLRAKSRRFALISIPAVALFFIMGMAFAYYVMLPSALEFLIHFIPGVTTTPRLSTYIGFITSLLFWIGVAFEFPLVIYVLAAIGLVRARLLVQQWRIAIVIIAVAAAAITPTVDPVNMSLVMGPMIVLYFLSIGLAFMAERGRS